MALLDRTQVCGMNIHYMKYSLDYFLDAQQRAGFKSIELWGGIPHIFMDAVSYEDTKQIASKIHSRGLEVKVFTPENCMYQYQFAASKPMAFQKSMDYFKNGIRVASELGCKIMQCNSGWGYLDEPAAGMNPKETGELMDMIRFVRDHFDMTILLIEHDMKLVSGICEKLTMLNFGEVLAEGATSEVLNNPQVITAYLGE